MSNDEPQQESLTARMGRGPLSLAEALRYATEIATCLRNLHTNGLVYGEVSSQLILLGPPGATLRGGAGPLPLGDGCKDVTAFGAVLGEIQGAIDGPEDFREKLGVLAANCLEGAPDMQQVLIALRILGLQARQGTAAVAKRDMARAREIPVAPCHDRLLG